eukprot:TRINITY_DN7236_c0_g1_i5.p1 TRINITY_DN7236_c0_g1~~TRINITY_DN7236_c0_g1_i5.p1  ORF type:complete len:464 (+),score=62.69 TRINITY_DN7236_c0_g1_i5:503-1894(+)
MFSRAGAQNEGQQEIQKETRDYEQNSEQSSQLQLEQSEQSASCSLISDLNINFQAVSQQTSQIINDQNTNFQAVLQQTSQTIEEENKEKEKEEEEQQQEQEQEDEEVDEEKHVEDSKILDFKDFIVGLRKFPYLHKLITQLIEKDFDVFGSKQYETQNKQYIDQPYEIQWDQAFGLGDLDESQLYEKPVPEAPTQLVYEFKRQQENSNQEYEDEEQFDEQVESNFYKPSKRKYDAFMSMLLQLSTVDTVNNIYNWMTLRYSAKKRINDPKFKTIRISEMFKGILRMASQQEDDEKIRILYSICDICDEDSLKNLKTNLGFRNDDGNDVRLQFKNYVRRNLTGDKLIQVKSHSQRKEVGLLTVVQDVLKLSNDKSIQVYCKRFLEMRAFKEFLPYYLATLKTSQQRKVLKELIPNLTNSQLMKALVQMAHCCDIETMNVIKGRYIIEADPNDLSMIKFVKKRRK